MELTQVWAVGETARSPAPVACPPSPCDPVEAIDAQAQAYVSRILALLGGVGALVVPASKRLVV